MGSISSCVAAELRSGLRIGGARPRGAHAIPSAAVRAVVRAGHAERTLMPRRGPPGPSGRPAAAEGGLAALVQSTNCSPVVRRAGPDRWRRAAVRGWEPCSAPLGIGRDAESPTWLPAPRSLRARTGDVSPNRGWSGGAVCRPGLG